MAPKTIRGKASITGYITDVDIEVDETQYEVYDKELPKDLPKATGKGEIITWFNNFGVRRKNGPDEQTVSQYRVFLQKLPAGRTLCVYHDKAVHDVYVQDAGADKPGKVVFTLDAGDPPVGCYP